MRTGCLYAAAFALAVSAAAQEPQPPPPDPSVPELSSRGLDRAGGLDAEGRARIEAALREGAYEQAETLLLEAFEREPQSAAVLRLLGGVRFVRGNALGAAVALKKAEALAPLDERSRFTLVMSYVVLGHRDWAHPELQTLAASAPRTALYPYWSARLDYDDGQYAAAVRGFLRAIELEPGYMKAHDNLGLCYEALGQYDDAIHSYDEAIRLNREQRSRSPWPPLNLGLLYVRRDRLDEAETLFRESLSGDSRFAQGHYQLGVVLEKKGHPAEAMKELEQATALDPSYPEPQYALARLYRKNGDAEKADRALAAFQRLKQDKKDKSQAGARPRLQ